MVTPPLTEPIARSPQWVLVEPSVGSRSPPEPGQEEAARGGAAIAPSGPSHGQAMAPRTLSFLGGPLVQSRKELVSLTRSSRLQCGSCRAHVHRSVPPGVAGLCWGGH